MYLGDGGREGRGTPPRLPAITEFLCYILCEVEREEGGREYCGVGRCHGLGSGGPEPRLQTAESLARTTPERVKYEGRGGNGPPPPPPFYPPSLMYIYKSSNVKNS